MGQETLKQQKKILYTIYANFLEFIAAKFNSLLNFLSIFLLLFTCSLAWWVVFVNSPRDLGSFLYTSV